ncbi:MAG: hypothetical protein AAFX99_14575, partial [Myxococcota bacterium]
MADSCEAGQEGCLCTGGACGPGLRCRDNTLCVDQTGFAGGACLGGQRCIRGNRCQNDVCVVCSLGSQGCGCRDNTTCNPGLMCDGDRVCVDPRGLAEQTPDTQVCTTPCTGSGLTLDNGRYMSCPASGLLSGCYGDSSCVEGQCLRPGAEPTRCETELDCPDFQTCLAHRCSSNCTTSEDCVTGATCHRQVCRTTCSVIDSTSVCGAEGYCHLVDGDRGVCMLNVPIDTGDPTTGEPIEVFTLSSDAVSLSNAQGTAPLVLTNTNPYPTTFTIAKRSDRRFDGDGAVEERLVQPGESCQGADCPMWWLLLDEPQVGSWAAPTQTFTLAGGAQTTLTIDNDGYTTAPRWEGVLEISSEHGVVRDVIITTTNDPTGQWSGEVYYFGNFKDMGIDAWTHDRDNPDRIDGMENAFMQLWARFRQGQTSFEQFQAGLTATRTESWRSPRLAELGCPGGSVCFPFDNFDGFLTYTTDPINIPVPTGVVEMPAMMNLKRAEPTLDAEACGGNALHCFTGRLESSNALQYAGEPRVTVTFESSPKSCTRQTAEAGCLVFLDQLGATIHVGARFATTSENTTCSGLEHMELAQEPWLVPGYTGRSTLDPDTGRRYTYTCRDTQAALPGANPMADGKVRERQLELIDGALVNGNILLIIFRERMDPILSTDPQDAIDGYGYMLLRHSDALLTGDQYEGHTPDMRTNPSQLRPVACTEAHFADLGLTRALFEAEPRLHADPMAQAILEGVVETEQGVGNLTELDHQSNEVVHYLCADTGLFDGGPLDDRASGDAERVPCPVGSRVTFFTLALDGSRVPLLDTCGGLSTRDCHQAWLAAQPCQTNGSCAEQLELWEVNATFGLRVDPYYQCDDPARTYCNDDRLDLRAGKLFYEASEAIVARPIRTDVADAFRYRTRFVNRSGTNVGFAPELCIPGTDLVPYCYDPEQIEALRSRTECAMELYTQHYDDLSEPNQIALWDYLVENFAYTEEFNIFNEVEVRRGFEFLDVELAIMLGDESYTRALASRFDLAELQVASFEGALFEEGGINISGMAGAEMVNLYQAVQYYQMGLDRFYDISPLIAWSVEMDLQPGGPPSFITQAAVESYFGRLIRASTQKAKAWAEIARRYQNFNRPDLARRVIERAYTAAYLESVVLTRLMQDIITITTPEGVTPIIRQIDDAQRSYRIALASMQRDYADISDDINYFGYAPDYIPFPALEHYRDASVEVALTRARSRVELAQTAEVQALEADQRYNTDAANFQNELTRIQNTYDSQLAELCGTFEADGQIYPATTKYAYLSPETLRIGDPCGRVQTGQISTAYGQMDILLTELRRVRQAMSNTLNEAQIEQARWNASCRANNSFARMQYEVSGEINTVQSAIDSTRSAIAGVDRAIQDVSTISQLSKCSVIGGLAVGGSCGSSAVATGLYTTAFVAYEAARIGLDVGLNALETEVRELQRGIELERSLLQCDLIAIDGQARVQTILLRLAELELDALKIEYEINQAISNINQLRNQATRLQQEMAEVEEQAINVEAARNNPNIRIWLMLEIAWLISYSILRASSS